MIGVGKSHNIDDVIEEATSHGGGPYDLVVALFPTRRLIRERRWVKNPPEDVPIAILRPRPRKACGQELNREWQSFETRGWGCWGGRKFAGPAAPSTPRAFGPSSTAKDWQIIRLFTGLRPTWSGPRTSSPSSRLGQGRNGCWCCSTRTISSPSLSATTSPGTSWKSTWKP